MSQTLQSIQSLSIQLNRAASMQDQLNEICHSPLEDRDQVSAVDAGASRQQQMTGRLSQLVSKKARRVKEMLLQNIGKADKTRDDLFHVYEKNFYKQQEHALKLHKEFKSYLQSLESCQTAGKSLNRCIQQSTGAYQSARHDLVCENLSQLEHLNEDLLDKLRGQVLLSLGEYLSQFVEMRNKIAKRRRKLIDYDSSRRHYEQTLAAVNKRRQGQQQDNMPSGSGGLQSATSQLVEEARLLKLREQFNYCKVMYEAINSELQEQLPLVYEKKMKNLLMSLQNYFSLEAQFHSNVVKLYATASDVIDELPISLRQVKHQKHVHQLPQTVDHAITSDTPDDANSDQDYSQVQVAPGSSSSGMGSSCADSSPGSSSSCSPGNCSPVNSDTQINDDELAGTRSETQANFTTSSDVDQKSGVDSVEVELSSEEKVSDLPEEPEKVVVSFVQERDDCLVADNSSKQSDKDIGLLKSVDEEDPEEVQKEEEKQSTSQVEQQEKVLELIEAVEQPVKGFLYKVKTIFKYLAEDLDELCFEADEIIQVVEQDEDQEPEEGWLIGVREVNGQRGLFPANFTHPV